MQSTVTPVCLTLAASSFAADFLAFPCLWGSHDVAIVHHTNFKSTLYAHRFLPHTQTHVWLTPAFQFVHCEQNGVHVPCDDVCAVYVRVFATCNMLVAFAHFNSLLNATIFGSICRPLKILTVPIHKINIPSFVFFCRCVCLFVCQLF